MMLQWARDKLRPTPIEPDPPGVTVPAWLVRAAKFASWVAMVVLVYFLWLYTLDIARDRAGELHLTKAGTWSGDLGFWFPYILGFGVLSFGIPYVAKIAIPTFMSLEWRGQAWPKAWALFIAMAVSTVVIAGTFTIQGETLMERDRASAVAVAEIEQGQRARQGTVAAIRTELQDLCVPDSARPTYQQQACRAGEASWTARAAQARAQRDYQADAIERSIPDARRGDELRAELRRATVAAYAGPVVQQAQRRVETDRTSWIGATLDWVQGVRAILLALVMDIVCLMMPWIALRLEQARGRQLGVAVQSERPIDPAHTIEDLRDEPAFRFRRAKNEAELGKHEIMMDAETGDRVVEVRPHRRVIKRKGKTQTFATAEFEPDTIPPDEAGKQMPSDDRVASAPLEQGGNLESGADPQRDGNDAQQDSEGARTHADAPVDDDDLVAVALIEDESVATEPDANTMTQLPDNEGVAIGEPYGPPAPTREMEDA